MRFYSVPKTKTWPDPYVHTDKHCGRLGRSMNVERITEAEAMTRRLCPDCTAWDEAERQSRQFALGLFPMLAGNQPSK